MTAIKPGTTTITASAAGVSDTCEVTVFDTPNLPDFSNANYDISFDGIQSTLQITNIELNANNTTYFYMITANNSTPELKYSSNGSLDTDAMNETIERFSINNNENYIYTRNLSKYLELNQDLYLWVIADTKLDDAYYDEAGNYITTSSKLLVNGEQLTRPDLPQLNLILQTFLISSYDSANSSSTTIDFNFPSDTENRKFTLKIGKITDSAILSKIQNNDYSGITDLLAYAKTHEGIYSQELTTTSTANFSTDSALFDGHNLLEHKAYYYIYAEFDDENGKYYPIEGVTLGQAWISPISNSWDLWAYTNSNFEWDGLTPSYDDPTSTDDPTISDKPLPFAGTNIILFGFIFVFVLSGVVFFIKYNKFKGIN